jgi:protein involved in polysaccharide export with SLBB domain
MRTAICATNVALLVSLLTQTVMLDSCSDSEAHTEQASSRPSTATLGNQVPTSPSFEMVSGQACKLPEMVSLWRERKTSATRDLPIGPGDIIDITASEIDELQNQKSRVSPQGIIELPLVGTLQAAGLNENELRDALVQRLLVYMKHPRVELYVENYRSRGVAVTGAVQKPGSYDMSDNGDSLMEMISLAGGLAPGAAQRVVVFPVSMTGVVDGHGRSEAQGSRDPNDGSMPRVQPAADVSDAQSTLVNSAEADEMHSVTIDLTDAGQGACLRMPARPGDVILVPVAGEVMVQGWVNSPGAFPITPGMTVLGAVSAAGGATFSWTADLIRPETGGGKTITKYSLAKLESSEQRDALVQSGDVVLVEKSAVGAVPFAIYSLFTRFGSGLAFPVF